MIAAETHPSPGTLRSRSEAVGAAWDELRTGSGEIRPHWQALMGVMDALGRDEFALRMENGRRILREHGVSCFSVGPGGERDRPWELDFIPFILSAEEWSQLSAGLIQRARLLNLVLQDLYGVHRLVRDGFIPAPLIFANPGYLRPCQAVRVPGNIFLQTYAADLARGPDGVWRVLADRTQAPAGLGFILENRSVLSRVLPDAIQALRPRPLSAAMRIGHDTLKCFADRENPNVALLTPGPRNEAYFEHAYLARLLGLTLVEGADLTVRDCRVWLKTLEGLRPVDLIVRRVTDQFCDPLALRDDSMLGVPGLVEATRAGRVAIANALGSGLVESPALLPFLPGLAKHLLGEELQLPSVDTWWCGQAHERRHVEEDLERMLLRPAFAAVGPQAPPENLNHAARQEALARLRARPHEFVAQHDVTLSRAAMGDGSSRPMVLRMFVLFGRDGYFVLPGGLARIMEQDALGTFALGLAGGSKDVWVLPAPGQQADVPLTPIPPSPALERLASDLPSRTAENLFWLGRYAERLERLLRICRSAARSLVNESANGRPAALAELFQRLRLAALPADGSSHETLQAALFALVYDESCSVGARQLLKRIHAASFSVRDRLSADTWRILSRLAVDAGQRSDRLPLVFANSALHTLVLDLAAFSGMEMENMTRGQGWVFLDLGRRLERGTGTAHLVESAIRCAAPRELLLEPLLEIADSVMTYRRRYFAEPHLAGVLDLLLLDSANPRALAFQLAALQRHAAKLPAEANPEGLTELKQRFDLLVTKLEGVRGSGLGTEDGAETVANWLAGVAAELSAVSDLLTHVYFSQVAPRAN